MLAGDGFGEILGNLSGKSAMFVGPAASLRGDVPWKCCGFVYFAAGRIWQGRRALS